MKKIYSAAAGVLLLAIVSRSSLLSSLLSANYLPHRFCYLAQPGLIWTNAIADTLIAASYLVLFISLLWIARKLFPVKEFQEYLWVVVAFATFIAACGATHLMEVVTVWWPLYPLSAAVKVACALASVPTAILFARESPKLARKIPKVLGLITSTQRQRDDALAELVAVERVNGERLQAEAKTAVAYSRLNHIMDSTSEGIFKIRFDWTILYGNRRAMEIIPNLCMERSYWDCFPAEKGTTSEHKLRTAMEQREQADWESYWETYKEWFAFHACPSEGGLSVFFVVITERKRVADQLAEELLLRKKREQDVEEANTRLNHVLDSTSEGILKVASNWTVVYCNVKGHEMLPDLAIGKDFWCCFPALKDSSAEQSLRAAMLDRSPVEYEIYYGPYAGWFRVNAFPTPGGISIFCTNITEHKRLEQELESERDRTLIQINSVMDSTSDCIVKLGPDWTILYGNRAAWQILPDLKLNTSYWDCFPAIAGTESEKNLRRTMEDRVETQWESFYEPYNEFYSVHAYPTQDGLSLFFVPITARKKLEQQVEKERMLRDSRIEALSNMAGGLAHEISNPLAIIHGTASDLQRMALHAEQLSAEEIRKASAAIVHTSDRAIRILRGLRGFAREGSKDPMEYASIYEILEQSLQMQEGRFARHHVELRSQVAADLPLIVCREVQIGQIVTNLLNNSFDAITQQNCPERWVRVDTILTNDAIEINVSDSGFGIDEEARKHLMEPFFTTKTRGLGMGVGLSLSRAIANEHGGTLELCQDGTHTCFRLVLPLKVDKPSADLVPNGEVL